LKRQHCIAVFCAVWAASWPVAATDFGLDPKTVDPAVPSPASILGHPVGQRPVRYEALDRYFKALADASPLVTLTPYAQSHEGRTLHYLTITSQPNHGRLEAIRTDNVKLADPRRIRDPQDADRIIETLPGIAWMAYSIHGDELSSTDAAIQVAYHLAAGTDEGTRKLREELVVHIDPLMNPDGRERYLEQLEHLAGKTPNPDYQAMQHGGLWSAGRGNHYLFDLNRDWLPQVHPETRGRTEHMLRWNPHLVVDSHEMGPLDTYLFDPPREPFNTELSEKNLAWRRRFSAEHAKAFDRHGWSYYTGEWYEEWYPGYTNAWANLLGAIGILYEQASVDGTSVRQTTGGMLTYPEAVHHHVVSSLANLESLRAHRREALRDFHEDRLRAVTGGTARELNDLFHNVFIVPLGEGYDRSRFERFADVLGRHGVEWGASATPFEAHNVVDVWGQRKANLTFPAGSLVLRSEQPHRRLLRALLGFDPPMSESFLNEERKELESRRPSRLYDITAWNLGMAFGLEAYWAEKVGEVSLAPGAPKSAPPRPAELPEAGYGYGYVIDGRDDDVYRAAIRLLDGGRVVRVAVAPFRSDDRDFPRGSLLLRKAENGEDLAKAVREAVEGLWVDAAAVGTALAQDGPDLGTNSRYVLLQQPRVAILTEWPFSTTSFGFLWYLLDARVGMRTSPINAQSIGGVDLRKYNVLVIPNCWGRESLGALLTEAVLKRIKAWVESGGTLVAVGESAAFLADKARGISEVRLRRDVLDEIPVYEDAWQKELAARDVRVKPAEVWGWAAPPGKVEESEKSTQPPPGGGPEAAPPPSREKEKPDTQERIRQDEWLRVFSPRGVIVAADLDPEHWLTFGLTGRMTEGSGRLAVPLASSYAFMSRHPVSTPVRLSADEVTSQSGTAEHRRLRLSGLMWPEARERWARTAYATVERAGNGQVILFAWEPFFRGLFEGTGRLFLNAVIIGPGAGTAPEVPW
jgi:hypothetical protein